MKIKFVLKPHPTSQFESFMALQFHHIVLLRDQTALDRRRILCLYVSGTIKMIERTKKDQRERRCRIRLQFTKHTDGLLIIFEVLRYETCDTKQTSHCNPADKIRKREKFNETNFKTHIYKDSKSCLQ